MPSSRIYWLGAIVWLHSQCSSCAIIAKHHVVEASEFRTAFSVSYFATVDHSSSNAINISTVSIFLFNRTAADAFRIDDASCAVTQFWANIHETGFLHGHTHICNMNIMCSANAWSMFMEIFGISGHIQYIYNNYNVIITPLLVSLLVG